MKFLRSLFLFVFIGFLCVSCSKEGADSTAKSPAYQQMLVSATKSIKMDLL